MLDDRKVTLDLEKINAQRITNVEQDTKEIRKDIASLMRELPHIVQDAVSQAVQSVKGKNGTNGIGSYIAMGAIVISIFAMLQMQIFQQNQLLAMGYNGLKDHAITIGHPQMQVTVATLDGRVEGLEGRLDLLIEQKGL